MTREWMINKVIGKYGENARVTKCFIDTCERAPEKFNWAIEKSYYELMFGERNREW